MSGGMRPGTPLGPGNGRGGANELLARSRAGLLRPFHEAGVLAVADLHAADALCRIGGEGAEPVRLAAALTVRALRNGSVCVDPRQVHATVFDEAETEIDTAGLPWPDPEQWAEACAASPLVAAGADQPGGRPLRLVDGLLYLERYWQQQEVVRRELRRRYAAAPPDVDVARLVAALDRLFPGDGLAPGEPDQQRLAAAVAANGWLTVLAGGPGTGKTTTVARVLALLRDRTGPALRIALAAPTGKAAARLEEAARTATAELPTDDRARVGDLSASTLHRLLGWLPGSRSRFRHDARNHLPHDVVVVDEVSMVSLTLMARLLEALRPDARLILVGDPDQLSSVDAGAVLADITQAPGAPDRVLGERLAAAGALPTGEPGPVHGVVTLRRTWRFGGAIEELARAVREADPDAVVAVLRSGAPGVEFCETDPARDPSGTDGLSDLAADVRAAGRATVAACRAQDVGAALAGLDRHRVLCAHRTGPYGVQRWGQQVERWLVEAVPGYAEDGEWYLGRPLLVTANDHELGLYNGDTGVIVGQPEGPRAAFARGSRPQLFAPVRLDSVQTVHAMTVHRAQGSQFDQVTFVVPPPDSPLLTRELLYTAVTRARLRVRVVGSAEAVRLAVQRPANRASGLRGRLAAGPDLQLGG